MSDSMISEGMLEVFIFESEQMLEQMEMLAMDNEEGEFDDSAINELFRSMHTIKGSSAVMMYTDITTLSHKLEDIFYYIRESHPENVSQKRLVDYILKVSDFIKGELDKIKAGDAADGSSAELVEELDGFLKEIKNEVQEKAGELPPEPVDTPITKFYVAPEAKVDGTCFIIQVLFKDYVEMANIKAYTMVYSLKEMVDELYYDPEDIMTNEDSSAQIMKEGFFMAVHANITTEQLMESIDRVGGTSNIEIHNCSKELFEDFSIRGRIALHEAMDKAEAAGKKSELASKGVLTASGEVEKPAAPAEPQQGTAKLAGEKVTEQLVKTVTRPKENTPVKQAFISVNVQKMDVLMDLIGELVIAEAVVLQNPDLKVPGLDLTNFQKAAGQLNKITTELQDVIMSMRMMPLTNTFQKMKRIVHDVSTKLGKDIEFQVIGENTEVDKNIIEHISDPLMHLVRNSVDHGIEEAEERAAAGKDAKGKITLEARNEGGKVWITVSDDGKGLSREKLLKKAEANGLLKGRQGKDLSDKEVYNLITLPGFSTKEQVTEYSGRGVGMDVVVQNIQAIGGSLEIDSCEGRGSSMSLKIPLTLAIIDGIIFNVSTNNYVIATGNVKEFLKATKDMILVEPDGTESMMLRGECYPILRLKEYYHLREGIEDIEEGMMIIIDHEGKRLALFVDGLVGEQEIVVKPIPGYIRKVKGLSGCTQLGDGSISLILDAGSLVG